VNLSDQSIQEFIEIYKKEFGKTLTCEEAKAMGTELLQFYYLIYCKPPQNGQHKNDK